MSDGRFRPFLGFVLISAAVVGVSLLIASYVIFPPGSSLTCRATFSLSETQRVQETFEHMFPGHMGMEPPEGRLLWAGFMALIVGVPSSLILRVWARKSSLRKAAVVGLGLGCFLEYLLESMLGLMLNSHHSESAGPFMSSEAPLISFRVDSVEPIGTVLNMISSLLIRTLYPLDVTGFYVLLLIPLAGGVLALMLTKKVGGDV